MRRSLAFQTARWSNAVRSNSPPSSRLMRTRRFLLNAAVTPSGIVVGEEQVALRLDEVRAEQQEIAGRERRADAIEERAAAGLIEVADVRAEEQDEHRCCRRGGRRRPCAALPRRWTSGPPPRHGRSRLSRCSLCSSACDEMSMRCTRALAPRARAPRRAGRSFRRCRSPSSTIVPSASPSAATTAPACRASSSRLRARDPVPRQPADGLEQARPERVVEVLRLQLLGHEREIARDIGGEFGDERAGCSQWHGLVVAHQLSAISHRVVVLQLLQLELRADS